MLRYQQQYTFFDPAKLPGSIRFINLSEVVLEKDLGAVLAEITKEVEKANPAVVVVDSFRTMVRKPESDMDLQSFIQRLALFLASWQATTFLIGEYAEEELRDNPIFTVADGLFWLRQTAERNSIVRKLQIIKLRGQDSVPGLHTFRITDAGVQAFSRTFGLKGHLKNPPSHRRLCFGIAELDKMLGGGVREGDSVLIAGSSGTGNRFWQPSSLPKAYARESRESWPCSRSVRKPTRNGPPAWGWIWKRRRKTENSKSSICVPRSVGG